MVDDEQLAREELCFLLGQAGGVEIVGQAADGVEALRLAGELRPDVVFLDVQMPGLTGFEVARRLIEADVPAAARLRHRVRPVRDRRVLGERRGLRPEAGRRRPARADARPRRGAGWRPSRRRRLPLSPADLERVIEAVQARQGRRDQLAIRVGERFVLVQADEVVHASLVDEAIVVVNKHGVRDVELPDARRAAGAAGPGGVLAGPPVAPGEHHEDQGDRALVQPELPAEDERPEGDGDPGQPVADAAAPGVSAAVGSEPQPAAAEPVLSSGLSPDPPPVLESHAAPPPAVTHAAPLETTPTFATPRIVGPDPILAEPVPTPAPGPPVAAYVDAVAPAPPAASVPVDHVSRPEVPPMAPPSPVPDVVAAPGPIQHAAFDHARSNLHAIERAPFEHGATEHTAIPQAHIEPVSIAAAPGPEMALPPQEPSRSWSISFARIGEELMAWFKTLLSAAVYATLIVTFGFQVARVEGQSMVPTLEDQDRLIVNKLAYRLGDPRVGDIVM